jgi:hypothetical protein
MLLQLLSCSIVVVSDKPWRWRDVIHRSELLRLPQTLSETGLLVSQVAQEHNNLLRRSDKVSMMTYPSSWPLVLAAEVDDPLPRGSLLATCYYFRSRAEGDIREPLLDGVVGAAEIASALLYPASSPRPPESRPYRGAVRFILESHHHRSHQCCPVIRSR